MIKSVMIGTAIAGLGVACAASASAQTMSVETEWSAPQYRSGVYVVPAPAPVYETPAYETRPVPRVYQRETYEYRPGYYRRPAAVIPPAPIPGGVVGGTIATRTEPVYPAEAAPVYQGGSVAYCMSQFRTYDPASGTYLGYDGLRYPCP
ncbi:BA14K family protein [Roseiarcaceae bacterium H3SJ34-1]|uniref:BA14K family protein n=1 Tax=Terripilifer ovatus TaxID=3032367 RepID=UPI003AB97D43|nr:BA14K family protein [Roseiarcaceae bacterium H3SJ34-1]